MRLTPLERSLPCVLPGNPAEGKAGFSEKEEEPAFTGFLVSLADTLLKYLLAMPAALQEHPFTRGFSVFGFPRSKAPAALGPHLDRIGPGGMGGCNRAGFRRIVDFAHETCAPLTQRQSTWAWA